MHELIAGISVSESVGGLFGCFLLVLIWTVWTQDETKLEDTDCSCWQDILQLGRYRMVIWVRHLCFFVNHYPLQISNRWSLGLANLP